MARDLHALFAHFCKTFILHPFHSFTQTLLELLVGPSPQLHCFFWWSFLAVRKIRKWFDARPPYPKLSEPTGLSYCFCSNRLPLKTYPKRKRECIYCIFFTPPKFDSTRGLTIWIRDLGKWTGPPNSNDQKDQKRHWLKFYWPIFFDSLGIKIKHRPHIATNECTSTSHWSAVEIVMSYDIISGILLGYIMTLSWYNCYVLLDPRKDVKKLIYTYSGHPTCWGWTGKFTNVSGLHVT